MVKHKNNILVCLNKPRPQPSSLSLIACVDSYDRQQSEFYPE